MALLSLNPADENLGFALHLRHEAHFLLLVVVVDAPWNSPVKTPSRIEVIIDRT